MLQEASLYGGLEPAIMDLGSYIGYLFSVCLITRQVHLAARRIRGVLEIVDKARGTVVMIGKALTIGETEGTLLLEIDMFCFKRLLQVYISPNPLYSM